MPVKNNFASLRLCDSSIVRAKISTYGWPPILALVSSENLTWQSQNGNAHKGATAYKELIERLESKPHHEIGLQCCINGFLQIVNQDIVLQNPEITLFC